MTGFGLVAVSLRLLTFQPERMVTWWAALLGGTPHRVTSRVTAIAGLRIQVLIEHSQIAIDYHPEASGVNAISLMLDEVHTADLVLTRMAQMSCRPSRVTREAGAVFLHLRDPNGTAVGLCLPTTDIGPSRQPDAPTEELDPDAVLAGISRGLPAAELARLR